MFMTDRQYATALFKPVYGCDPDTDELQTRLVLVSRLADPAEGQAEEDGGQIGIQEAGFTGVYEFRYSPANNSCKLPRIFPCSNSNVIWPADTDFHAP